MSVFEQMKNAKILWIVTALAVVTICCIGTVAYMMWDKNRSEPADAKSAVSSSSSQIVSSSSSEAASSSEPSSSDLPSSSEASSSLPAPVSSSKPASSSKATSYSSGSSSKSTGSGSVTTVVQNGSIDKSGLYDAAATYSSMTIKAGGVTLKDKTINGNLYISSAVGTGEVTLENVIVKGQIIVEGGSKLTLNRTSAAEVILAKASGSSKLVVAGASTVDLLTVKSHADITETELATGFNGIDKMNVLAGNRIWQEITLTDVGLSAATVNIASNIDMNSGSSIALCKANAAVHFTGKGKIETLQVASDDISYATTPGSIKNSGSYDTPVKGGTAVQNTDTSDDGDDDDNHSSSTLSKPTGLSLTYNPTTDSFTASWSAVSHSSGYGLVPIVGGSSGSTVSISSGTTSYTLPSTDSYVGKTLAFKVYAKASGSYKASAYTTSTATATIVRLASPTFAYAYNTVTDTITYSWGTVTNATGFRMTPVVSGVNGTTQALASTTLSQAFGNETNSIKLRATATGASGRIDSAEVTSSSFTRISTPTLTAAYNTDATPKIVLSWGAVNGESGFQLTLPDGSTEPLAADMTSYSYTPSGAGPFAFSLKALGSAANRTRNSATDDTATVLAAPTGLAINYNATTNRFVATWNAVTNSNGYTLVPVVNDVNGEAQTIASGTTTYTFPNTAESYADHPLSFKVLAKGNSSLSFFDSAQATASEITPVVLDAPTPTGLVYDAAEGQFRASWSTVPNSAGYTITPIVGGVSQTPVINEASNTCLLGATYNSAATLSFKVLAKGSGHYVSSTAEFTPSITPTQLAAPANLAVSGTTPNFTITWDAVANSNGYTLYIVKVSGTETKEFSSTDPRSYTVSDSATITCKVLAKGTGIYVTSPYSASVSS